MKVFKMDSPDEYEWALPVDDAGMDATIDIDGTPRATTWRPFEVEFCGIADTDTKRAKKRPLPADIPWSDSSTLILKGKAVAAVGGLLSAYGELLPITAGGERLALFNCTTIVDALDHENSDIQYIPSTKTIMRIKRHAFHAAPLVGKSIFIIPKKGSQLYFQEDAVQLFTEHKLTGLTFIQLWEGS